MNENIKELMNQGIRCICVCWDRNKSEGYVIRTNKSIQICWLFEIQSVS